MYTFFQKLFLHSHLTISVTLKCHSISLYYSLLTRHFKVVIIFPSQERGYV